MAKFKSKDVTKLLKESNGNRPNKERFTHSDTNKQGGKSFKSAFEIQRKLKKLRKMEEE